MIAMAAEPADLSCSCNTHLPAAFTETLLTVRERLLKAVAVTKGSVIERGVFFYSLNLSGAIKGVLVLEGWLLLLCWGFFDAFFSPVTNRL